MNWIRRLWEGVRRDKKDAVAPLSPLPPLYYATLTIVREISPDATCIVPEEKTPWTH